MDRVGPLERSAIMRKVASEDTGPELLVRRALFTAGLRYRLHRKDLPGSPDIVFPTARAVVFVHGCFWHHHQNCRRARLPQSNTEYWRAKFSRNVARDRSAQDALKRLGWQTYIVWECEASEGSLRRLAAQLISRRDRNRKPASTAH